MGGNWEHKDGTYDYVPVDCIRRGLYFSSKVSYGELTDLISVRFNIQHIRRLSYKFSTYVYPVDIYDDNDMSVFLKILEKNHTDICYLYVVDSFTVRLPLGKKDSSHGSNSKKKDVVPDLNIPFNHMNDFSNEPNNFDTNNQYIDNNETFQNYETNISNVLLSSTHPIVNKVFKDKEELKLEVSMMALNECFEFKVQKSSKERFVVKCCGDNCEWVLRASTYNDTNAFHVTSFKNEHTCSRTQTYPNIRNANKKVIGHIIKDQLTDCGRVYRGKEIVKDINQRFKVNISYKQAWRGKHYAEQLLSGSAEEAFVKLPAYCHNLELANPGTITHILRDEFNRFEMVFIAIGAAVRSFVNCMRPIIIIDGAHLKGTFKGTMFLAVGMDGNNQILPIAFGVGKTESGDAWTWFLSKLKDGIADHPELAIISDRASSIDLAIRTVYPLAYHGLCCRHLMVNLRLKGKAQESLWWATCKAYTISDFETNYNALCAMRPAIRETLTRVGFHKWARSHCPVQRFNIMTSNSAESINASSRNARKLPITKLIDFFVSLVQKWYFERRQLGAKNAHHLTKWAENKISKRIQKSKTWTVRGVDEYHFNVDDGIHRCIVDVFNKKCGCRKWQLSGLPCGHVIAVSVFLKQSDCTHWAMDWFKNEVHVATYAESVNTVPDEYEWEVEEDIEFLETPQMDRRQAGRPRENKRIPSRGEETGPTICSRCHHNGHMRHQCKTLLASQVPSSSKVYGKNKETTKYVDADNFRDFLVGTSGQNNYCYDLNEF
ncbi:hypothetical protein E3N88_06658 [Mikania micrantha]|uniref:SWIM-type domain-containing protein n=1 Tax=Mikania micrantha TaxID=192012 RepID=A0A5N6PQE5_9ASTR|nr:hypothetical protein E3N88_06658 [Mikania micrantha]